MSEFIRSGPLLATAPEWPVVINRHGRRDIRRSEMKSFGAVLFGILALVSTLFALAIPFLWPFFLIGSVPFWLIFFFFLIRSLRL